MHSLNSLSLTPYAWLTLITHLIIYRPLHRIDIHNLPLQIPPIKSPNLQGCGRTKVLNQTLQGWQSWNAIPVTIRVSLAVRCAIDQVSLSLSLDLQFLGRGRRGRWKILRPPYVGGGLSLYTDWLIWCSYDVLPFVVYNTPGKEKGKQRSERENHHTQTQSHFRSF